MEDLLRTFEAFSQAVRESVDSHAKRKNYTTEGPDGENQLLKILGILGIHEHHAVGELIYKCAELLKAPTATKKVLCEKIAGWAFVIWREL